jgi:hypothetical protein
MAHPAAQQDLQYAMEGAYTSDRPAADAYSQSLEPPNLGSFGADDDDHRYGRGGAAETPDGGSRDKLNAEESAALRSFLAGGDESGEGVVLPWDTLLPLAQSVFLLLAIVCVWAGVSSGGWKVGVALGTHRAHLGLGRLVLLDAKPRAAGIFKLSALCKGTAAAAAAGPAPMELEMACAFARTGAATQGLAGAALALLLVLLLLNLYAVLAARGLLNALQPLVRPLEAQLDALPRGARESLPTACWAGSLFFLALALVVFGSTAPAGLGLGAAQLGLSFGAVRLGCLFVACGLGVHATSLSEVWRSELLVGTSLLVAKSRQLSDRTAQGVLLLLAACVPLHLTLWTRAVDWAVLLPLLGLGARARRRAA